MLDPDSDSLRDRIAVWLRGTYEDAVEDATGSTPPEGAWLADADGVLLVLHRYEDQAQRTRPVLRSAAQCGAPHLGGQRGGYTCILSADHTGDHEAVGASWPRG